ncbi:MAG: PP2C family protein-serine/threonine phosphatase [Anaerolineales bacterium]|jgi:sigma-B regulation protein RsbU (phosphoserine phosphatase)
MEPEPGSHPPSERLELLYHLSQTFNSSLDLEKVLNKVMDEVIPAVGAERGFVVLRAEENRRLDFRAARGIDQNTIVDPQFQISRGVVESVIENGEAVLTSDAQSDERFSARMSVVNLRLRSILCAPLKIKSSILGAIYVDNSLRVGIFTEDDLDLLCAIAASAAVAIENARLYQVAVEKGRMERELQLAYKVQASLIPPRAPSCPGWDFAARWIPAREVAGDFYDYFLLGEGELGVVIGDVADKGMASALFMANCRSVIRASMLSARSLQNGMRHANRLICADSTEGIFLTLFYARLDLNNGELAYINAGHNPPLLMRDQGSGLNSLKRTGVALGVDENARFEVGQEHIDSGDLLCLYTDGVTEAMDGNNQQFGVERLEKLLSDSQGQKTDSILEELERKLEAFTGSGLPFDDITLLVVKREGMR